MIIVDENIIKKKKQELFQKMYIEHKEYLVLLDQIDYLKRDNSLLRQQNSILTSELLKQQQKRLHLQSDHVKNMNMIQQLHSQVISHGTGNKNEIIEKMTEIDKETKEFLESKFTSLQNSSLTQVQTIELKNAKTKLGFYQLTEFANKLRAMYKETLGIQNVKAKKQPTLMDLLKWIKSIPGVAIGFTRTGFSTSMSMSNIKKQASSKYKFKENHSLLNSTQSRSRVKM